MLTLFGDITINAVFFLPQSNSSPGERHFCGAVFSSKLRTHYLFSFFSVCHDKAERVHELNEEIGKLLAKAEQLGSEGNVDEAQQVLEKVEKTRALKKEAEVRRGY